MEIVFATNNENKTREIRHILGNSFTLLSLSDLNINEDIPENEPTLEGNAMHKARYVHNIVNMNVFADDTGLEIDALNGLPGVNSARFAGENKDSDANIDKAPYHDGLNKKQESKVQNCYCFDNGWQGVFF